MARKRKKSKGKKSKAKAKPKKGAAAAEGALVEAVESGRPEDDGGASVEASKEKASEDKTGDGDAPKKKAGKKKKKEDGDTPKKKAGKKKKEDGDAPKKKAGKKKRSKKKRTPELESDSPTPPESDPPVPVALDEPDAPSEKEEVEDVIDLDADLDDHETGVADLLAEALALDEAPDQPIDLDVEHAEEEEDEVVVQDLDVGLDEASNDAAARERLIAETLAFVESEEGGGEGGDLADTGPDVEVASDAGGEDVEPEGPGPIADGEASLPDAAPEQPVMSPAAIAALEAIQRGVIAGDLDEDVLDLGDVSDPDERDRLLASAMAHAEMQEARYRVTTDAGAAGRWKGTIASMIFLIALVVLVRPPGFLVPDPPATLTAEDNLFGVRVTLLLQAEQIEAYRTREEQLPRSLAEVDARFPDVRFVRSSSRLYQLIAYTLEGEAVVYDSATPDPAFAAIERTWVTTRDDL